LRDRIDVRRIHATKAQDRTHSSRKKANNRRMGGATYKSPLTFRKPFLPKETV
jgi:hypothetical protein